MKKNFTIWITSALLLITVAGMNAQDANKPWHLIAYENVEVASYNVEVIAGIEVDEQNITITLDNGKKFSHPKTTTIFSFDPRDEGTGTPNESMIAPPWNVHYINGRLHFSEEVNGVSVYSSNGALVAKFSGNYREAPLNLSAGIYVIHSEGKSAKLLVSNAHGSAIAQPEMHDVYTPEPVRLRTEGTIKVFWNIEAGHSIKSVEIPEVQRFNFTNDNLITFSFKTGKVTQLADFQRADFSVEPAQESYIYTAKPIGLTERQGEKMKADNRFAFKMFKEVSALNGSNTFFSPLSLHLALGMLYNGSSGETRTEMADVLGLADFTDLEINEYYQILSQALLNIDPLTDLCIANSIWYRDEFPVKQSFMDINQTYFDAMVKAINFSNPDAADIINQWCADKTKEKIKEIIKKPIREDVMMYLINALYFKSNWQYEFDKTLTKSEDFTTSDNRKVKVNMMMQENSNLRYYGNQNMQCIELPYGNEAFSMMVVLPGYSMGYTMDIEELIAYLDDDVWQTIVNSLFRIPTLLKLPRFKVECELPLNEPVMNTGMKRIFDGGFDNISDVPLKVSNIKQKTFVEVNEAGTEAAAVTVIEMYTGQHGPYPFFANVPFLYLIMEKSTGAILFIGRMDEPEE